MGCCLIGLIALVLPRVAILLLAIFTRFMHDAYDTFLWPVLGFVFMPYTTLTYAYGINAQGSIDGLYLVLVVVGVLVDLGQLSGGGVYRSSRRRRV